VRATRGGGERLWTRGLALVALAAVVALVVIPLGRLGWVVLGDNGASIGRVLGDPGVRRAAMHSVILAVVVAAVAVPLGTAAALALRRPDVPCRTVLRVLIVLPLVVPQFVLGYSWSQAYGRAGFTDQLVGLHWDGLTGPAGIAVVLVVDAVPICFLLTTVGLATRAESQLDHAARVSGASAWTTTRTVTVPLLRPVLAAEVVLVFLATLESFAAPQVLGAPAGYATLTTRLYADLALGSEPDSFVDAMTLAMVLVVIAAALLVPADLALAPRLRSRRAAGTPGAAALRRRGWAAPVVAAALAGYAVLAVLLPGFALLAASVTRAVGLPPTPGNWTLANFRDGLSGPALVALGHSVQLAIAAACILTAFGALLVALDRRRTGRLLASLPVMSFAIPGSALAVGLLIAYGGRLGDTLALMLIAYLAKFWAIAHRSISGAADRIPIAEWQAARTAGAGPVVAVRTVWLPSLAPALLGAWVLVCVTALHEVTMSSLLYSAGNETFAVYVLNSQELGGTGTTAALSVTLTALMFAVIVPAWLVARARARVSRRAFVVPEVAGAR
jgi:iron(III) transport system permease protein